jgi:hypothetical protein
MTQHCGLVAVLGAPNVFPVRATYEQEVVKQLRSEGAPQVKDKEGRSKPDPRFVDKEGRWVVPEETRRRESNRPGDEE